MGRNIHEVKEICFYRIRSNCYVGIKHFKSKTRREQRLMLELRPREAQLLATEWRSLFAETSPLQLGEREAIAAEVWRLWKIVFIFVFLFPDNLYFLCSQTYDYRIFSVDMSSGRLYGFNSTADLTKITCRFNVSIRASKTTRRHVVLT